MHEDSQCVEMSDKRRILHEVFCTIDQLECRLNLIHAVTCLDFKLRGALNSIEIIAYDLSS
jgi:hypothetical protein